jgi:hypothetical protein
METPQTFKLQVVKDQTFTKQTIHLSGIRYENCRFIDCTLSYVGGPGEMSNCFMSPNTVWAFGGPVPMILETLQRYGWRFVSGTESPEEPIRFPSDAM